MSRSLGDGVLRILRIGCEVGQPGTTSGEKMHKSRHTAGQRVLDATGNLKAVQKLLGHASIQTTGETSTPTGTPTSSLPRWPTFSPQTRTTKRPIRNRFPPTPVPAAKTQKLPICSGNEDSMERTAHCATPS
jgi:hypothetical protein